MEKTLRIIGIVCACLFVGWLAWYLLCEPDIHDQRERASDVTESLDRVGEEQRNAESNIERIERGLDDSIGRADAIAGGLGKAESRIADSTARNAECSELVADSERRIEESKSILQAVRSRAGQDGK